MAHMGHTDYWSHTPSLAMCRSRAKHISRAHSIDETRKLSSVSDNTCHPSAASISRTSDK